MPAARPLLTPLVAALPSTVPFVGPEAQERERGRAFRARIGANESSFGPSPRVIAAHGEVARDMWMYCDPDNYRPEGGGSPRISASRSKTSWSAKA